MFVIVRDAGAKPRHSMLAPLRGYAGPHLVSRERAAQMSAHSPSDSSTTKISAPAPLGRRVASYSDREAGDVPFRILSGTAELAPCNAVFPYMFSSGLGETARNRAPALTPPLPGADDFPASSWSTASAYISVCAMHKADRHQVRSIGAHLEGEGAARAPPLRQDHSRVPDGPRLRSKGVEERRDRSAVGIGLVDIAPPHKWRGIGGGTLGSSNQHHQCHRPNRSGIA
jgi:hypothetical protein